MGYNMQNSMELDLVNKDRILQCQTALFSLNLCENLISREFSPIFTVQVSDNEIKGHVTRFLIQDPQASTPVKLNRESSFRTSDRWPASPNQHKSTHLPLFLMCLYVQLLQKLYRKWLPRFHLSCVWMWLRDSGHWILNLRSPLNILTLSNYLLSNWTFPILEEFILFGIYQHVS